MNKLLLTRILLSTIAFCTPMPTQAQDGRFFSAKPPIVVRYEGNPSYAFHFTNTSDKPLHGVRINVQKDGEKKSTVLIDTIEPHKTAAVDQLRVSAVLFGTRYAEATITCTNYSSPIAMIPPH